MIKKLLCLLVLLLTATTGAWGMQIYISYPSWPTGTNVNGDGNLVLEIEASDSFENVKAKIEDKSGLNPTYMKLYFNSVEMANDETLNAKGVTSNSVLTLVYTLYNVTMKDGVKDADKWTVKVGEATTFSALPLEGVAEGQTVTLQYTGRLKVKGVKATSDAAPGPFDNVTASDKGKVIGADGKIYADAAAATAASTTAVAMIAYVGNDAETNTKYNHGLAIALTDASTAAKWDTNTNRYCLSPFGDANAAKGDMAGIANTDAIVKDGHTHAAASAARNYNSGTHPDGTSEWFLPSAGQWDKMITAAGGGAELRTKAGLASDRYWSSTESSKVEYRAWQYNFSSNGLFNNAKTDEIHVRAVLAF